MRFIFYFFFFGLLFYVIWLYFPEAFQTLVSWAGKVYTFLHDLVVNLIEKINSMTSTSKTPPVNPETPKQIAHFLGIF
jgi:hypothetical protein